MVIFDAVANDPEGPSRKRANSWMAIAKGIETSLTVMLHGFYRTSYNRIRFDGPNMQYHVMPCGQNIPKLTQMEILFFEVT